LTPKWFTNNINLLKIKLFKSLLFTHGLNLIFNYQSMHDGSCMWTWLLDSMLLFSLTKLGMSTFLIALNILPSGLWFVKAFMALFLTIRLIFVSSHLLLKNNILSQAQPPFKIFQLLLLSFFFVHYCWFYTLINTFYKFTSKYTLISA
jgi:hypothetical protein